MQHGGARPGAGRKCSSQARRLHGLMNAVIEDAAWRKIIRHLREEALGDEQNAVAAARLLLHYAFEVADEEGPQESARPMSDITQLPNNWPPSQKCLS